MRIRRLKKEHVRETFAVVFILFAVLLLLFFFSGESESPFGCLIGGIICAAGGVHYTSVSIRKIVNTRFLLKNGTSVYAVVADVLIDKSVAVNKRNPLKLLCQYTDEYTGQMLEFESDSVFNSDIDQFIGMPVEVYFDPANPSNHYVDLKQLVKSTNYLN